MSDSQKSSSNPPSPYSAGSNISSRTSRRKWKCFQLYGYGVRYHLCCHCDLCRHSRLCGRARALFPWLRRWCRVWLPIFATRQFGIDSGDLPKMKWNLGFVVVDKYGIFLLYDHLVRMWSPTSSGFRLPECGTLDYIIGTPLSTTSLDKHSPWGGFWRSAEWSSVVVLKPLIGPLCECSCIGEVYLWGSLGSEEVKPMKRQPRRHELSRSICQLYEAITAH